MKQFSIFPPLFMLAAALLLAATPLQAQTPTPGATSTPVATLPVPELLGPPDGSIFYFDEVQQTGGVDLTWTPIFGATFYRVVIDGPPALPFGERNVFVPDPHRLMTTDLLPIGEFVWTVQAYQSETVFSEVSEPRRFEVRLPAQPTPTPLIVNPDINRDDVVDLEDLFLLASTWGEVFTSPKYRETADIFPDGVIDTKDLAYYASGWRAAYQWTPTPILFPSPKALAPVENAVYAIAQFNNNGQGTLFTWEPVALPDVADYELLLDTPGTTIDLRYFATTPSQSVLVTSTGEFAWRVRARNAEKMTGVWSPWRKFTIVLTPPSPTPTPTGAATATPAPLDAPEPVWPPNETAISLTQLSNRDISWEPVAGAARYHFTIKGTDFHFFDITEASPRIVESTGTRFLATKVDTYRWRVRGVTAGGVPGEWSDETTFSAGP